MRKIRIRRSTLDKLFEYSFKLIMAIVLAVLFVGVPVTAVTGESWCGVVATWVSCSIIYYIFEHIEIKEG